MQPENNQKVAEGKDTPVSITLMEVPGEVHDKLKRYRRRINNERQTDFNLRDAYVEFLKEATKNL